MDYSDEELYDIVVELDEFAHGLSPASIEFIADVLEREQMVFSEKQRKWILDLKDRHLI